MVVLDHHSLMGLAVSDLDILIMVVLDSTALVLDSTALVLDSIGLGLDLGSIDLDLAVLDIHTMAVLDLVDLDLTALVSVDFTILSFIIEGFWGHRLHLTEEDSSIIAEDLL